MPRYIGNFCKGLPQDEHGVVQAAAYEQLLKAITSGDPTDFEAIPLGQPPVNPPQMLSTLARIDVMAGGTRRLISKQRFYRTTAELSRMTVDQAAVSTQPATTQPTAEPAPAILSLALRTGRHARWSEQADQPAGSVRL